MPQYIPCADIYYTQDSISQYFSDGTSIDDPICGKPIIDVFKDSRGRYWTLNNRTLYQVAVAWERQRILCNVFTSDEAREEAMEKRRGFNGRGMHNGGVPWVRNVSSSDGSSDDTDMCSDDDDDDGW